MITIEQCRGARGLIGWTQQDLAEASGLSKTAINNFEKGHSDIKAESLRAIRMAFESADVEFLGYDGVRRISEHVEIFKGPKARASLIEDIYLALQEGQELLILNTNPDNPALDTAQLEEKNIAIRSIISDEAEDTIANARLLSTSGHSPTVTYFIYANKFATELWDQSMIFLTASKDATETMRQQFETLWLKADATDIKSKNTERRA